MSDASPEPLIPGEHYAQAVPAPQTPARIALPATPNALDMFKAPPAGALRPAANDNRYRRTGPLGRPVWPGLAGAAGIASQLGAPKHFQSAIDDLAARGVPLDLNNPAERAIADQYYQDIGGYRGVVNPTYLYERYVTGDVLDRGAATARAKKRKEALREEQPQARTGAPSR